MVGTVSTEVSQARVFALGNYPTIEARVTQARLIGLAEPAAEVHLSQARVFGLGRGRVNDPRVRAWTYTLDGHDFYVLRLGNTETLVYDTYSEQWSVYGSNDTRLWKAYTGTNWLGGDLYGASFGSNVIVGDDGNGSIYFLDPDEDKDDDSVLGVELKRPFKREVQSQLVLKGYDLVSCFGVELEGSIGDLEVGSDTTVNLQYSDDRGNTYEDAGNILAPDNEYHTRLDWQSLGSMNVPGRLFKITDRGALKRIDSMLAVTDLPEG